MPDEGYLNARIRGMKTRLLTGSDFDRLLATPDEAALAAALSGTQLRPQLDRALVRQSGADAVVAAVNADFAAICRKVLSICEKEQGNLLGAVLRRWDAYNLKTVLRGKHATLSPVEIMRAVIPAGEFDTTALQEMSSQPGVREVIDLLATWRSPLAEPLVETLGAYLFDKSLLRLELALDQAVFAEGLQRTRGPWRNRRLVRGYLREEIDLANIMAKIRLLIDEIDTFVETPAETKVRLAEEKARLKEERRREAARLVRPKPPQVIRKRVAERPREERPAPPPIQQSFIPGGLVTGDEHLVELLRCRTMGELLRFLAGTSYGRFIGADMLELESIPDLPALERTLEADLVRRAALRYRREPVGTAMAFSFLFMKYAECLDLRVIARGKEFGMPVQVLKGEMIRALTDGGSH
jgi:V/A-type H+-transporting ATPase subunit C